MKNDKEVRTETFIRTSKFSVFKSNLKQILSCVDASDCYNRIVMGVDNFLHCGRRMSNKYRRVYWLCRNEEGGIDMFDSHNHGEDYVDDTLLMTVTVDIQCFLNSDAYIIETEIEWYFNSNEV